ncbi:MAG: LysM peptidoglycan-binding protein [Marmoricola sp.]|nr:LysM peptidoglycan-binding protein [Marmoricola sp.]
MSLPRRHPTASTPHPRRGRWAARLATLASALTAVTVLAPPAQATPWPGHPDRSIVPYVVRAGDTATGLAVRYHAWTEELIDLNRLGPKGSLHQGQTLSIPIVVSAVRRAGGHVARHRTTKAIRGAATTPVLLHPTRPPGRGWLHADLSREQVRRLVVGIARRYGVPPQLALAVAWQESGWQQRRISSTGALGVMQVMPDTGRWMRWYVGRPLRLRDTHDNVLAGVMTLRVLRAWTRRDKTAIAAYYQGLGAVRRHGYYTDTRQYVAAVRAHERRIARTGSPV